jgi:RNA polymerase sigma-70 factor (ECF subfamily)
VPPRDPKDEVVMGYAEIARPKDHELVAAARTGGSAGWSILIDRHYDRLLRYLAHQTRDPELAADLAQDAFLDAFRTLATLAEDRSFAAWLHQIAHNRLRMEWRRRQLRRVVSLDWLAPGAASKVPALRYADASEVTADLDALERALDGLSEELREAFLLSRLSGFRGGEVALILGISHAAARKRISRAQELIEERCTADRRGGNRAAV